MSWHCPVCGEGYPSRRNAIGTLSVVVLRGQEIEDALENARSYGDAALVRVIEAQLEQDAE